MKVPKEKFLDTIQNFHLISTDILLFHNDNLLLGNRINNPAKNTLFVPGSRMFKNETVKDCAERVCREELGLNINFKNKNPFGCYEHSYTDNVENENFGTKYIVFPFSVEITNEQVGNFSKMFEQHNKIVWVPKEEILNHPDVHSYVKNYFLYYPQNKIL